MDRFLVQVSKNIGYSNIVNNRLYQNHLWKAKPRDVDHGAVKSGDELMIYCTNNVPNHSMSLAFSVAVKNVSDDNVTFELDEPRWFPSPLKLQHIRELVNKNELPAEFRGCGQQGFNIIKLAPSQYGQLIRLVGLEPALPTESTQELSPQPKQPYAMDDIVSDGCFPRPSQAGDDAKPSPNQAKHHPPRPARHGQNLAGEAAGLRSNRTQRRQQGPTLPVSPEPVLRGFRARVAASGRRQPDAGGRPLSANWLTMRVRTPIASTSSRKSTGAIRRPYLARCSPCWKRTSANRTRRWRWPIPGSHASGSTFRPTCTS